MKNSVRVRGIKSISHIRRLRNKGRFLFFVLTLVIIDGYITHFLPPKIALIFLLAIINTNLLYLTDMAPSLYVNEEKSLVNITRFCSIVRV